MAPPRLLRSLSRSHSSDQSSGVLDVPMASPGRGSAQPEGRQASASKPLTPRDLPRPEAPPSKAAGAGAETSSASQEVRSSTEMQPVHSKF